MVECSVLARMMISDEARPLKPLDQIFFRWPAKIESVDKIDKMIFCL